MASGPTSMPAEFQLARLANDRGSRAVRALDPADQLLAVLDVDKTRQEIQQLRGQRLRVYRLLDSLEQGDFPVPADQARPVDSKPPGGCQCLLAPQLAGVLRRIVFLFAAGGAGGALGGDALGLAADG